MKRRCFLSAAGTGIAGMAGASTLVALQEETTPKKRPRYKIEIEIYEAREDTWCHKKGDKFQYPQDIGKLCPWLLTSMHDFLRLMQNGVTLPWKYEGTPYEKVINKDGVTTEFVRCPDPTADLVAKITRKQMA
jgi:uncharacterized repeat protein (TIGR04076 family)